MQACTHIFVVAIFPIIIDMKNYKVIISKLVVYRNAEVVSLKDQSKLHDVYIVYTRTHIRVDWIYIYIYIHKATTLNTTHMKIKIKQYKFGLLQFLKPNARRHRSNIINSHKTMWTTNVYLIAVYAICKGLYNNLLFLLKPLFEMFFFQKWVCSVYLFSTYDKHIWQTHMTASKYGILRYPFEWGLKCKLQIHAFTFFFTFCF